MIPADAYRYGYGAKRGIVMIGVENTKRKGKTNRIRLFRVPKNSYGSQ